MHLAWSPLVTAPTIIPFLFLFLSFPSSTTPSLLPTTDHTDASYCTTSIRTCCESRAQWSLGIAPTYKCGQRFYSEGKPDDTILSQTRKALLAKYIPGREAWHTFGFDAVDMQQCCMRRNDLETGTAPRLKRTHGCRRSIVPGLRGMRTVTVRYWDGLVLVQPCKDAQVQEMMEYEKHVGRPNRYWKNVDWRRLPAWQASKGKQAGN